MILYKFGDYVLGLRKKSNYVYFSKEETLSLPQKKEKKRKTVLGRKNINTKVANTMNLNYPKTGEAFGVARVSLMRKVS